MECSLLGSCPAVPDDDGAGILGDIDGAGAEGDQVLLAWGELNELDSRVGEL